MRFLICLLGILLSSLSLADDSMSQQQSETMSSTVFSETKIFTGTVLKKTWAKNVDSYCAGGSDYFVLQQDEEETLLKPASDKTIAFTPFVDQTVIINGYVTLETVNPSDRSHPDQPSQHLVNPVTCEFLVVTNIQLPDN